MEKKEYIDREAFKRKLIDEKCVYPAGVDHALYEMPAADVAPVVHGEWVWDDNARDWGLGAWVCGECRCTNDNIGAEKHQNPYVWAGSKFCPNCGAKMDGGKGK